MSMTPQQKQYMHISEWMKSNTNADLNKEMKTHEKIVKNLANTYSYNNKELYNNLFTEGLLGLIIAITKYKDNKNTNIKTYIYLWVKAKMLRFLENNIFNKNTLSLDHKFNNVESDQFFNEMIGDDISTEIFFNNIRKEFEKILNTLPLNQYLIITRRYLQHPPSTLEEISKLLNISRSYIRILEFKAIKFLKENIYKIQIKN